MNAANSWDHHLMEKVPPLQTVIGDHAGRQFTPADPIVVVGMIRPDFITKARPVDIVIDLNDLDPARGFKVTVTTDPVSRIMLVESVDREIFRQQLLYALRKIAAESRKPACPRPVHGLSTACLGQLIHGPSIWTTPRPSWLSTIYRASSSSSTRPKT